jgi:hypothetical protein
VARGALQHGAVVVGRALEQLADDAERELALELPAARVEHGDRPLEGQGSGARQHRGLADPGLAHDRDQGAACGRRPAEDVVEDREFVLTLEEHFHLAAGDPHGILCRACRPCRGGSVHLAGGIMLKKRCYAVLAVAVVVCAIAPAGIASADDCLGGPIDGPVHVGPMSVPLCS